MPKTIKFECVCCNKTVVYSENMLAIRIANTNLKPLKGKTKQAIFIENYVCKTCIGKAKRNGENIRMYSHYPLAK